MIKKTPVGKSEDPAARIDIELERSIRRRAKGPDARLYNMLRYFLGFVDQDFKLVRTAAGKRFRPRLALSLADGYRVREKVIDAAVAIELFHNFTLIHDDIEDHDEMRRGRPTVWRLWGVNDAINAGDALNLLVTERVARVALVPRIGARMASALTDAFLEVIEGQHLDFFLADASLDSPEVSEARYLRMIKKKTGALVRISAGVAGIAAGKGESEISSLNRYAESLGLAYQLADDYQSMWGSSFQTGKDAQGDIREHKRTLPFLRAYAESVGEARDRLKTLYSNRDRLTQEEVREAAALIDSTDAASYLLSCIRRHVRGAEKAAQSLTIPAESRALLLDLIRRLVPEIPGQS